jgi:hypothetical protein
LEARLTPSLFGPVATTGGLGTFPQGIAAGDLNGDGRADLVVANQSSNSVSVLLNDGNGHFPAVSETLTLSVNQPRGVVIADFNNDGFNDLAVANGNSMVLIYLNNPNQPGSFAAPSSSVSLSPSDNSDAIAAGDFDGDGFKDLAVANINGGGPSGSVSILRNNGSGAFSLAQAINGLFSYPSSIAVADAIVGSVSPGMKKGSLSSPDSEPACRGDWIRTSDLLNPINAVQASKTPQNLTIQRLTYFHISHRW